MTINIKTNVVTIGISIGLVASLFACTPKKGANTGGAAVSKNAAEKVYVAPGKHDEFYAFLSGGFSGQLAVYGLPSGRLLRVIPVYSVNPENGYGFTEETKKMLNTSHGFVPWDDSHHPQLSLTEGKVDGRYAYINANNTPRIAKIDLKTFKTTEIIEIPNSGGNHGSPYLTENTEYLIASTRFSIPLPNKDVALEKMKDEVKGTISFIKFGKEEKMEIAFQLLVPGIDYDLASCGKGPSHGYCFLTSYNSEKASTLIEINASKNDKDLLAIVNWKKAEECVAAGKAKTVDGTHMHNELNEGTHTVVSDKRDKVKMLDVRDCEGALYYAPVAKSPHGADVDPSGQYIIAGGKLAAQITAYDFGKITKAIQDKKFTGEYDGVKVLDYESVIAGEVKKPCLGPLHTEFDGKGNAYTSCFVSSEVVKWKLGTWQVVDRMPTYYSLGHIMIPGSGSKQPWGKYLLAMNKITKDRYLPVGPELPQSAQLIDISGEKMEMLLDFPTVGEPHYAVALEASLIKDKVKKIYTLEENKHPYAAKSEKEARVVREGNVVHVYGTAIRSHFMPDNIEGIKVGDTVYFHVTNLEQDWDIAHGFSIIGANTSELLLMPGETNTFKWEPSKPGVYPFYCTDFCSALHQEMQGYIRVSAAGSSTPMKFNQGK